MAATSEALHPQTQTNLHVAILTVARLHGLGDVPDSIVGYLMDEMRDSLSPAQRMDPLSVYSFSILGLVEARVKETYGIDRPVNIHAAPPGPQGKELPIPSDSMFALDGLGRNRFEQLTGATSGSYARLVADTAMSSVAYSAMTVWNPTSGDAGLNEFNFGGTPFAAQGLDLPTTKYLFSQGFTAPQIVAAAQDTKALGFSPKDKEAIGDHAIIRARDPQANETNRRLQSLQGTLASNSDYQPLAEQWRATTDPVERARLEELMQPFERDATIESGVQERLDDPDYDPKAKGAVERRRDAIVDGVREGNLEFVHEHGTSVARDAATDLLLEASRQDGAAYAVSPKPPAMLSTTPRATQRGSRSRLAMCLSARGCRL